MPSDRQIEASTPYVDKISKMIPAEFVGAYTAIHNIIESNSGLGASDPGYYSNIHVIVGIILLLIMPFYMFKILNVKNIAQTTGTMIAFIIWAISIGGIFYETSWYYPYYSTIAIIIWTLISPMVVQK